MAAMGCVTVLGSIMVALATFAAGAGAEETMPTEDVSVCSAKTLSWDDYSRFQANVGAVMALMEANGINSKTYGRSRENGEPMAYVEAMCESTTPEDECLACVKALFLVIQKRCPNAAGARAKQGHCFFRYETFRFTWPLASSSQQPDI